MWKCKSLMRAFSSCLDCNIWIKKVISVQTLSELWCFRKYLKYFPKYFCKQLWCGFLLCPGSNCGWLLKPSIIFQTRLRALQIASAEGNPRTWYPACITKGWVRSSCAGAKLLQPGPGEGGQNRALSVHSCLVNVSKDLALLSNTERKMHCSLWFCKTIWSENCQFLFALSEGIKLQRT